MCSRRRCLSLFLEYTNQFINPKMCKFVPKFVPDWFVTAEMLEKCQDEEWLEAYKQRKAQKAMIKEELLPIAMASRSRHRLVL